MTKIGLLFFVNFKKCLSKTIAIPRLCFNKTQKEIACFKWGYFFFFIALVLLKTVLPKIQVREKQKEIQRLPSSESFLKPKASGNNHAPTFSIFRAVQKIIEKSEEPNFVNNLLGLHFTN